MQVMSIQNSRMQVIWSHAHKSCFGFYNNNFILLLKAPYWVSQLCGVIHCNQLIRFHNGCTDSVRRWRYSYYKRIISYLSVRLSRIFKICAWFRVRIFAWFQKNIDLIIKYRGSGKLISWSHALRDLCVTWEANPKHGRPPTYNFLRFFGQ